MKYLHFFFSWLFSLFQSTRVSSPAPAPAPPAEPAPAEPPAPPSPYDVARAQHAALKAEWDKGKDKVITLREGLVCDNAIYYTLADMGDLSRIRQVKMGDFMNRVAFGITPHYLAQHEKALAAAIASKDHKRQETLSIELISRYKASPSILSLCELGSVAIFRHDENPYTFNPVIHADKVKLMQMNAEAQLFFCELGWEILEVVAKEQAKNGAPYLMDKLEDWGLTSKEDFLIYLEDELAHGGLKKDR